MGAGASTTSIEAIATLDEAKQREVSDELFDKLDKVKDGKLNLLEMKKGFAELEAEGTVIKLSASRFAKIADKDGDKMVDKDEFYAIMSKVLAKGDIAAFAREHRKGPYSGRRRRPRPRPTTRTAPPTSRARTPTCPKRFPRSCCSGPARTTGAASRRSSRRSTSTGMAASRSPN